LFTTQEIPDAVHDFEDANVAAWVAAFLVKGFGCRRVVICRRDRW